MRQAKDQTCNTTGVYTVETYTLTVNANPTVDITTTLQNPYCPNTGNVTLEATSGFSSYSWSGDLVATSTNGNSATFNLPTQCGQDYDIAVTVENANGCKATSNPVTLTMNDETAPVISSVSTLSAEANGNCIYVVPNYLANGVVSVSENCPSYTVTLLPASRAWKWV